jgi:hypothetical protein
MPWLRALSDGEKNWHDRKKINLIYFILVDTQYKFLIVIFMPSNALNYLWAFLESGPFSPNADPILVL